MTDLRDRIVLLRRAHRDAELAYRRILLRPLGRATVTAANAYAEGLAMAIAVLEAVDVVDVRARVRAELDRAEADGMAGVDGARAELAARRP